MFFVLVSRQYGALDEFDVFDIICGKDMLDRHTFLLHGPLPWASLAVTLTVTLSLAWAVEGSKFTRTMLAQTAKEAIISRMISD